MKRISIIIPCYNVEAYIDRCFDSLCQQTIGLNQMELIFVNDASTDGTLQKLLFYEREYPNDILVINFEENRKQGAARNVALTYATAPYIGYVDSDDVIESDMFEKMLDAIETYDCDFVQCRWDSIDTLGSRKMTKPWKHPGYQDLTNEEIRQWFISTSVRLVSVCDKVYKRDFLVRNGIYCPEGVMCEDVFFSHMVFAAAKSVYCMDDILYHYYINSNGTMQKRKVNYQEDVMAVSVEFLQACKERGLYAERKDEIEWFFLENFYVYLLWEMFSVLPEQSYVYYQIMKETIQDMVPDYKTNVYRSLEGNEFDNLMLRLLDYELSEEQFLQLRDNMLSKMNMANAEN